MEMKEERELIVRLGREMSARGLSHGTAGNLSIYDPQRNRMAISPSGIGYFDTKPEDVVLCDLEGHILEGTRKPSSEYGLHAGFYRARAGEGCLAVVHTHSNYATTLACMGEPIRAVHYMIAPAGIFEIPVAEYATFGTPELAESAVRACKKGRAVLLANHGLVAFGKTLEEAFTLADDLEALARIQWQCMCAGRMNVLTDAQMQSAAARFQTYGQTPEK